MKKLEKLEKALNQVMSEISKVSFERRDTSYRRSGGYFGTEKADVSNVLVISAFERTKYLSTYICVDRSHAELVAKLDFAKTALQAERQRLAKIANNKWAKESITKMTAFVDREIASGTVNTNYAKMFIQGNSHIYGAHPYYGHSDYNKFIAMPNTPKHWAIAQKLNEKLIAAGLQK